MSRPVMSVVASFCYKVFFFFLAAAIISVYFVFDSAAFDYRFVALGVLLPLLESLSGRPLILHTLAGSVLLLTLVMFSTVGHRLLRRSLLAVPVGTFIFLVASTTWTRTDLFWWPFAGFDGIAVATLPEFDKPILVLLLLELAGLVSLIWFSVRLSLTKMENLRRFWCSGRLPKRTRVTQT